MMVEWQRREKPLELKDEGADTYRLRLALHKFYVDASDQELEDAGVTRAEVLKLARDFETADEIAFMDAIAHEYFRAYRLGKLPINRDNG